MPDSEKLLWAAPWCKTHLNWGLLMPTSGYRYPGISQLDDELVPRRAPLGCVYLDLTWPTSTLLSEASQRKWSMGRWRWSGCGEEQEGLQAKQLDRDFGEDLCFFRLLSSLFFSELSLPHPAPGTMRKAIHTILWILILWLLLPRTFAFNFVSTLGG